MESKSHLSTGGGFSLVYSSLFEISARWDMQGKKLAAFNEFRVIGIVGLLHQQIRAFTEKS